MILEKRFNRDGISWDGNCSRQRKELMVPLSGSMIDTLGDSMRRPVSRMKSVRKEVVGDKVREAMPDYVGTSKSL